MSVMKCCLVIIIFNPAASPEVKFELKNDLRKGEIELTSAARKLSRGKQIKKPNRRVLTLDEIYLYLKKIGKEDGVTVFEIGKSYKGVPIYAVKIHKEGSHTVSTMVVEFGIHAREWASPASAVYLIKQLLRKQGRLIEAVQWYVIPVLNPDGYNYSTHSDDMWRKNRRPLKIRNCPGVDLNRNFGVAWNTYRDKDECSESFAGYEPFSEPEALAVRNMVEAIGPEHIDAYVAVHTCAQSILHPYGYKHQAPALEKLKRLKKAGKKMADKMYKVRRVRYPVRQASTLGAAGGGSDDFMFEHHHVSLVYTLELGDASYIQSENYDKCFHPRPKAMKAITKECYAGLKALAEYDLHYKRKKIGLRMAPIPSNHRVSVGARKSALSVLPFALPLFH